MELKVVDGIGEFRQQGNSLLRMMDIDVHLVGNDIGPQSGLIGDCFDSIGSCCLNCQLVSSIAIFQVNNGICCNDFATNNDVNEVSIFRFLQIMGC